MGWNIAAGSRNVLFFLKKNSQTTDLNCPENQHQSCWMTAVNTISSGFRGVYQPVIIGEEDREIN
jgi:hypothetical protein